MLRQEAGRDKRNVNGRAPKVMLRIWKKIIMGERKKRIAGVPEGGIPAILIRAGDAARLPARRLSTSAATEVVSEGGQTLPRPVRAGWNRHPRAGSLRERGIHAPCRRLRGLGEAFCPYVCGFARFRRRAVEPDACRP